MPSIWNLKTFRCLSRLAKVYRDQLVADMEQDSRDRLPQTLARVREMNELNRRESLIYRLVDRSWLLPLTAMIDLFESGSNHIEQHGMNHGCRLELDRMGIKVEGTASKEADALLKSGKPILYAGNHPCTWGPDMWAVASALDQTYPNRDDFVSLTWSLVLGLCPGLARYAEPVIVTSRDFHRFTHDDYGTADDRKLGFESMFECWTPDIPLAESRRRTGESLDELSRRWSEGGDIFIFPTGGAGTKALWFAGLGRIIRSAAERLDGARDVDPHVLLFRIEGASDFQLFKPPFLSPFHVACLLRVFSRRTIKVHFDKVFRLHDWRDRFLDMTDRSLARHLQQVYNDGKQIHPALQPATEQAP